MTMHLFFSKANRREKLKAQPFPSDWLGYIEQYVPYYQVLPAADQEELRGHIQVFLAEKKFIGAQGFVVTELMRVVIAAQACILLLHRPSDYFPELDEIVLYPTTFVGMSHDRTDYGVEIESPQARLGESSKDTGIVVLAWDSVMEGSANIHDGNNVVFHEFAHQLDAEDGHVDGAPRLASREDYATWAKVLSEDYEDLLTQISQRHKTLIDAYGATNPAEFFAVTTETFFEKPKQMKSQHPALYRELSRFYQQDPATLMKEGLPSSC